jgi:hypothetical protein
MKLFSRKGQVESVQAEETIHEQKTTKFGYFLLFIMVIFIVGITQTIFYDLGRVVASPEAPSRCVSTLVADRVPTRTTVPTCSFGDIDREYQVDVLANVVLETTRKLAGYNGLIDNQQDQLRDTTRELNAAERAYELSLQEKIAEETVLFERTELQAQIQSVRTRTSVINQEIATLTTTRDQLFAATIAQRNQLDIAYQQANVAYDTQKAWYKTKVFGLMLVFVLPFFIFSVRSYFRLKQKNSPYTIISAAIAVASSLLFLQVVGLFLYDVLLGPWIVAIIEFLLVVPLFRYVLYYGSVLLVIGIFGGIVYLIQRRIHDPVRVARRRLNDNKCPNCSFKINRTEQYCPSCATTLQRTCTVCGQQRFAQLPVCHSCGDDDRVGTSDSETAT